MRFDEKSIEKLRFDHFGFDNALLNNSNNPDETFNNLSQRETQSLKL